MYLPAQMIRYRCRASQLITPFFEHTPHEESGKTFGLSPAGYDVRVRENVSILPGTFALVSTLEHFNMPDDLIAFPKNKSSWMRKGLCIGAGTVIEPGWRGFLTLEIHNRGKEWLKFKSGTPIAQILFARLDAPTEQAYEGRYQDQGPEPVPFIPVTVEKVG